MEFTERYMASIFSYISFVLKQKTTGEKNAASRAEVKSWKTFMQHLSRMKNVYRNKSCKFKNSHKERKVKIKVTVQPPYAELQTTLSLREAKQAILAE